LQRLFPASGLGHTRGLYGPATAFATTTTVDGITTTQKEAELFDRKGWIGEQSLPLGTRAASSQVPAAYEIPPEVIREAIVNAVAHRDYTSNGSVQVMVFADRVEIWNPGSLPPSLSLAQLRQPHGSIPANPLLAEPLYLTQYIERLGTGTGDMIRRFREAGLSEPVFALEDGFRIRLERPLPPPSSSDTTEETKEEAEEERRDAGGQGAATDRSTIRRDQILAQLRANPQVTIAELARLLNLSDSGVEYNLRKLRQAGRIRREGSTKAGRWDVVP
jgi:ATP-dependent DNA helicase RecG